jgi:hypothetical protein
MVKFKEVYMDDKYLYLRCYECENCGCQFGSPIAWEDSHAGCTRQVSQEQADEYYHYTNEVMPFLYIDTSKEYQNKEYNNFMSILDNIYSCPLGKEFNNNYKKGKRL